MTPFDQIMSLLGEADALIIKADLEPLPELAKQLRAQAVLRREEASKLAAFEQPQVIHPDWDMGVVLGVNVRNGKLRATFNRNPFLEELPARDVKEWRS